MTQYELYTLLVAGLSLFVAGIALGWNIFRDCIDRPKLKINIFIADVYITGKGNMPRVVSVNITNIGNKPIMIKGHGLYMKDKTQAFFPDIMGFFNKKKLEPYDFLDVTLPNEILRNFIEKSDQLHKFFIFDTTGRKWYPKKKILAEFLQSLKKEQSSSSK